MLINTYCVNWIIFCIVLKLGFRLSPFPLLLVFTYFKIKYCPIQNTIAMKRNTGILWCGSVAQLLMQYTLIMDVSTIRDTIRTADIISISFPFKRDFKN